MNKLSFNKNDPEIRELLKACALSTKVFAKTMFKEEVSAPFSILHNQVFEKLDSEMPKRAVAAPRGLGKTTLAKIRAIKAIVFREVNFIIYLSNSATAAEMQTENIKRMILQSDLLRMFFGDIKISQDGMKDSFSKQSWVAYGDVFVLPRGAGQQVRGLNWMGHRPGMIIIDDLETLESVQSEDQRKKLKQWFFSDLMKTETRYGAPSQFIYIDTIKHEDALLKTILDAPDWDGISLSICNDNLESYDPNYMTTEELRKAYEDHKAIGETDLFYMEYMNIPISLKDAVFKEAYFKYFSELPGKLEVEEGGKKSWYATKDMITAVIVDPARTVKLHSAESAIITISVERTSGKIFVRDVYAEKVEPDILLDEMFSRVLIFRAMFLAVEVTGLSQWVSQPIENQMRVRGIYPQYIELSASGRNKAERVGSLASNYRLGYMYHNKSNSYVLEQQLLWFPKSKRWDAMDALSYINFLMDSQSIYFDPGTDEDLVDEFDEIEDDEILQDDWRII
jgi:hypothetical protein